LQEGEEFQDFAVDRLYDIGLAIANYSSKKYQMCKGENRAGIEIKYDRKFKKTGNLWIELSEKSDPFNERYVPSGIYRGSWLFLIGNYDELFIFSQKMLKMIAQKYTLQENGSRTSIGYLLPKGDAEKYAARTIKLTPEKEKIWKP